MGVVTDVNSSKGSRNQTKTTLVLDDGLTVLVETICSSQIQWHLVVRELTVELVLYN